MCYWLELLLEFLKRYHTTSSVQSIETSCAYGNSTLYVLNENVVSEDNQEVRAMFY